MSRGSEKLQDFFSLKNYKDEMAKFSTLTNSNQSKGKVIFSLGESLVFAAQNGSISKFYRILNEAEIENLLMYFIVKALRVSLFSGYLAISAVILDSGYPLGDNHLPNVFYECIESLPDDQVAPIVQLFGSHSYDMNTQVCAKFTAYLYFLISLPCVSLASQDMAL